MKLDLLVRSPRVATCDGDGLGVIERGALGVVNGRVAFVGKAAEVDASRAARVLDVEGALLPGLVDPHTHLVFAGSRVREFGRKMSGVDYRTIAAEGGGIMSTVHATREASDDELYEKARARALVMRAHGTTSIEIKSGYGLTPAHEMRILRVAKRLQAEGVVRVTTTYLGAHAVPKERDRGEYIAEVIATLPEIAREKLAEACDVYLDAGAFSRAEAEAILSAAKRAGLAVRAHVGQFEDLEGAELVASMGGLSVDHLEALSAQGATAIALAGVVAVLLPGAWRTLRQTPPDVEQLRRAGAKIAVGTDCNPGTSPMLELPLAVALAVRDAGLTPEEGILAVTRHAAEAAGLAGAGILTVGAVADFVVLASDSPECLAYALSGPVVTHVARSGALVQEVDPAAAPVW